MKKIIATKANKKLFEKRVYEFVNLFGLLDWELHVINIDEYDDKNEIPDNLKDFRAMTVAHLDDKLAMIILNNDWDVPFDNYWITRTSFHECFELLMWPITENLREKICQREVHSIIRTMENVYFPLYWNYVCKKGKI